MFEVGDTVVCVNGEGWENFVEGEEYTVTDKSTTLGTCVFINDVPVYRKYLNDFELVPSIGDRLEAAKQELEAAQKAYEEEKKRKEKWEPEGGSYWVNVDGKIEADDSSDDTRQFGIERATITLAKKARDDMRAHNRALVYVHEHAPDWDGSGPYTVFYIPSTGRYCLSDSCVHQVGAVIGPLRVMRKLTKDLNSGRVIL